MTMIMRAESSLPSFHMHPSFLRKTRRELNSTHMGQSIKSGKELVQHPDQLLSGQGRGEVGKSFNICKKNTKQQGRDGVGRKHINILIHPGRHINTTQRNQPWSEVSAPPAMESEGMSQDLTNISAQTVHPGDGEG